MAETTRRYAQRMLPVLLFCEEHLEEPLSLNDLAAVAGFSPYHFHRIFHHITGEAPKEYVRRLRLERAAYRLKVSPDNVLRIALESGFSTHETFTRAFTRRFDISPSAFRAMLRELRAHVDDDMGIRSYAGFSDDTPLTLRFDMRKDPVTVERTPVRHLLFVRHSGYENLLPDEASFLSLWNELFSYADEHGIAYSPELLVGLTHDDPYVTDEPRIRFDACLLVSGPTEAAYPVGYRALPAGLCVVRRHTGGLEEIAKTFAYIGVEWLPAGGYGLSPTAPYEMYHCVRRSDGRLERTFTEAYVPLEFTTRSPEEQI